MFNLRPLALTSIEEIEFSDFSGSGVIATVQIASTQLGTGLAANLIVDGNSNAGSDNTLAIFAQGGTDDIDASGLTFQDWTSNSTDLVALHGNNNANTLIGTTENDVIEGNGGADNIDGGIRNPGRTEPADAPDSMLDPDAVARTYLDLVNQHRSAWSTEIAIRPWVERF